MSNIYHDNFDRHADDDFRHVYFLTLQMADKTGIRAALDHYKMIYPAYAEALELTFEESAEFDFLHDYEPQEGEVIDEIVTEEEIWYVREITARANGYFIDSRGNRYEWDGNCWTDSLGNGFSTLFLAVNFC